MNEQLELELEEDGNVLDGNVSIQPNVSRETNKIDTKKYMNLKRVLSVRDINGDIPDHIIYESNRSDGKTTTVLKFLLEEGKEGRLFALKYRRQFELSSCEYIFVDILAMYPEIGTAITVKSIAKGMVYQIFLDGELVGFAVCLYYADETRKVAPIFRNVYWQFMDEMQPESGRYLDDEFNKNMSMSITISRGGGKQARKTISIYTCNPVTIMNPYYIGWGIYKRLRENTKKLKGKKWVALFVFNEDASKAVQENNKAFSNSNYLRYASENVYFKDASAFISKPKGHNRYMYTLDAGNINIGVRYYPQHNILYCSKDSQECPNTYTFKNEYHTEETIQLPKNHPMVKGMKEYYFSKLMRFDNIETKEVILDFMAINVYS